MYVAYVSMDIATARNVIQMSYSWETEEGGLVFGNNMSYYESVQFGNFKLNNVWCTPLQTEQPQDVRYTALFKNPNAKPIGSATYNHVFMQEAEYRSLQEKDPNTIYFIWEAGEGDAFTFDGKFPITLS